jgi:hypothetical protein
MMAHSRPKQNENMKNLLNYSITSEDSDKHNKNNSSLQTNNSIRKALAEKIGDNPNLFNKKY